MVMVRVNGRAKRMSLTVIHIGRSVYMIIWTTWTNLTVKRRKVSTPMMAPVRRAISLKR
jgi:hypothetical protein